MMVNGAAKSFPVMVGGMMGNEVEYPVWFGAESGAPLNWCFIVPDEILTNQPAWLLLK